MLPSSLATDPNWWPIHLLESASRAGAEASGYVFEAFGTSQSDSNLFYEKKLQLADPYGRWPSFSMTHGGHILYVVYHGSPRYEVTYGHSSGGQTTTWASDCGSFMLPGFRWAEVCQFAQRTADPATPLLLLLPAVDIPLKKVAEAEQEILASFVQLGFDSPLIPQFSADLAEALSSEREWVLDQEFGWVTNDINCWRCRHRPDSGLLIPDDHAFSQLKRFSELQSQTQRP